MKLKILSVDFNFENENVDNSIFEDQISFIDYDAVVIDPKNILNKWFNNLNVFHKRDGTSWLYSDYDGGLSESLRSLMEKRKEESELLTKRNQGIVVCFLRSVGEKLNCSRGQYAKYKSDINRYSWVPIMYDDYKRGYDLSDYIKNRSGKEIGKIYEAHPFAEYIKNFKDEIRYEAVLDEKIFSQYKDILSILQPIATNKAGELVAFEIAFGNGKFIFLPPVMQPTDNKKLAGIIISCIKNITNAPQLDSPPPWIANYSLPGDNELSPQLDEIREKEDKLKTEREEIEKKGYRLNLFKSLLYGNGKYILEPAVREAFKIIGFNVLDPDAYNEEYDLFATEVDLSIIGEIEGSIGQIDVKKYRQLLDYVSNATLEGKKCKGLLIGNGFLGKDPNTRPEQFTEKAITGCRTQNFCRITTFELFKAVKRVLASSNDLKIKESIMKAILSCNGDFNLSSLDIK
jgi:hypothetical protein